MFIRLTYLTFPAGKAEESKEMYLKDVAPAIRKQKGNKDALLLEPVNEGDEYISYTLWESEADMKTFEAGSTYQDLIGRIKQVVSKPPYQRYYRLSQ